MSMNQRRWCREHGILTHHLGHVTWKAGDDYGNTEKFYQLLNSGNRKTHQRTKGRLGGRWWEGTFTMNKTQQRRYLEALGLGDIPGVKVVLKVSTHQS